MQGAQVGGEAEQLHAGERLSVGEGDSEPDLGVLAAVVARTRVSTARPRPGMSSERLGAVLAEVAAVPAAHQSGARAAERGAARVRGSSVGALARARRAGS